MATPLAPVLTVFVPGHRSFERTVERFPFVIGRDATCDLHLDFSWISRRQLVLEASDDGIVVRPEGKTEMSINEVPLDSPRRLTAGDRLDAGAVTILFDAARAHPIPLDDRATGSPTLSVPMASVMAPDAADRHLARLGDACVALTAAEDAAEVCTRAARAMLDGIDARGAAVMLLEDKGASAIGACGVPISRASKTLIESAIREATTISIEDEGRPILVAPICRGVKGVLYAVRNVGDAQFGDTQALFVSLLAHLVGPAYEAAKKRDAGVKEHARLVAERELLMRDIERRGRFGALIGTSAPMQKLAQSIAKVAPTDATVLVLGETGAGKELVAREIHGRSNRAAKAFFALNCAALPEGLIESELFGHRKGAFTGADRDRQGAFELAEGGTVFLDEIGELPPAAQAKVLRVLDRREVLPLGASRPIAIDVRLVAATHRDLGQEVAAQRFRQDLFYRLNVFPLRLPALRERPEDIAGLVEHFLAESAEARTKGVSRITPRALAALAACPFPGNVRELAHVVQRAVILCDAHETIDLGHLPDELAPAPAPPLTGHGYAVPETITSLREAVAQFERAVMQRELDRDGWNRTRTAERLDVSLRAFMDKLKKYQLKGPR